MEVYVSVSLAVISVVLTEECKRVAVAMEAAVALAMVVAESDVGGGGGSAARPAVDKAAVAGNA